MTISSEWKGLESQLYQPEHHAADARSVTVDIGLGRVIGVFGPVVVITKVFDMFILDRVVHYHLPHLLGSHDRGGLRESDTGGTGGSVDPDAAE